MSHSPFRADGRSPLTQYVQLLIEVPRRLARLLTRDADALRILSALSARPEPTQQTDRSHATQRRAKRTGKIIPMSRIWTRRDKRLLDYKRKQGQTSSAFFGPERRTDRFLNYLRRVDPRYGFSLHDYWFRQAVDETRRDGTAAALCTTLARAKECYESLLTVTRYVAHDTMKELDFDFAKIKLDKVSVDLMDWTKPAGAAKEGNAESGTVPTGESKVAKEKKRNADKSDGRPKTKRDKLRDQRLKFCVPLHNKGQTWSQIFLAYYKKFPSDKKASPDTLRLTFARNSDDI